MNKEVICTVCPRGCHINVVGTETTVENLEGYGCKRGIEYATNEYLSPVRILTTIVKIEGVENDLLPVRSNKALPKDKLFDCMEVIRKATVKLPVKIGDVIVENICDTGVDIVATKPLA
ncbi:MAG: DUF1667 domain-containing protein [Clostridia bacterium]|nr:DUF1667 domain-containing protein [Clostridia bacterium]